MEATASRSREVERFKLRVGDVLITKDSEDWRVPSQSRPSLMRLPTTSSAGTTLGSSGLAPRSAPSFLYRAYAVWGRQPATPDLGVGCDSVGLPNAAVGDALLPLPPLDEQRAIAAYLDRETERIDALVAKKRLLIERLEEYRSALITRTVTRGLPPEAARAAGLDPSPRLKPSGVEWLGEVPEHWEVASFRCGAFGSGDEPRSPR